MSFRKRLRFSMAFLGGKLWLEWIKFKGKPRNDRPGMVSMRLDPDFLYGIAKPPLTIVVTGTNGKTTVSAMLADILRAEGKTVAYNDWGANHHAGVARVLLAAAGWRNHPIVDAAIIELDELISPEDMPALQPDYIIVTNLGRDSMLRNGHPGYIRSRLEQAIASAPGAKLILNADDPISCFLGRDRDSAYFGVLPMGQPQRRHLVDDFCVCPHCGAIPEYVYRNYRHMGRFRCPSCGLESPHADYLVEGFSPEERRIAVQESGGTGIYTVPSAALHNVANTATVIALFREMGYDRDRVGRDLLHCRIPASRESRETVNGIELMTQIAKAQNPTAVSTVMEYLASDQDPKEIAMILDEHYDNPLKTETVAWEYDTDFEFLKEANVQHIVFTGARRLDLRFRLLLAGIPAEKLVMTETEQEAADQVTLHGVKKIIVLHDVNAVTRGRKLRDRIRERILQEGGEAL